MLTAWLWFAWFAAPVGAWLGERRRRRAAETRCGAAEAERDAYFEDAVVAYRALTAARLVGHVPGRRHCIHHRYVRGAR
jgi:hypothetical protein